MNYICTAVQNITREAVLKEFHTIGANNRIEYNRTIENVFQSNF